MQRSMIPLNAPPGDGREAGPVVVVITEQPCDYVVWSIASLFYGNPCCLGLLAFYYSIKSRDRKLVGDMTGANMYGSKAGYFNACALALIIILTIGMILMMLSVISSIDHRKYYK